MEGGMRRGTKKRGGGKRGRGEEGCAIGWNGERAEGRREGRKEGGLGEVPREGQIGEKMWQEGKND